MSIEQIESEIRRLPPKDLAQFITWFDAFLAGVPSLTDSDQHKAIRLNGKIRSVEFGERRANPDHAIPTGLAWAISSLAMGRT